MGRTLAIKLYKNLLYANYMITKPYTPRRYHEEYAGISEGSGVSLRALV